MAPSSPISHATGVTPMQRINLPEEAPQQETPAFGGSAHATPAQRVTTPAPVPQAEAPADPPLPYAYEYLTDEVMRSWQDGGRQSMVHAVEEDDALAASAVIQELLRASLDGKVEPSEAGSVVKDLIFRHHESGLSIQSLFLDTVSLLEEKDWKNRALSPLVAATGIDPDVVRHELDVLLLQSLQLVRNTFNQMRTRKTTNILYRQANFNLLREESEGYAKLITDYYNAAQDANAEGSDPEMAKDEFHRIMALVGAFDLDVGRVLDITLDISANSLVKSYRFFVKFYRASSWWPDITVLDNVQWIQEGPSSLPGWAFPGSNKWQFDEQDRERLAESRLDRDIQFWQRVRQVGMDAYSELGARKIVDYNSALPLLEQVAQPERDAKGREINADHRKRINENRKYMRETRMLPPSGNPDAAQLLGFKLRFYASPARDVHDILPENLIYLAALLIKIGFVSLRDLYPHLYPPDEAMEAERARLEKEKAEKERRERPGGGRNALIMAGALADDTIPVVRILRAEAARSGGNSPKPEKKDEEEEAKNDLPPPTNQKILLLKSFLAIGALPEALFILGRFPWLVDVDTSLPPFLHRIANQMLSKMAEALRPLQSRGDVQDTKRQLSDTVVKPDGSVSLSPRPKTKVRKWLGLDGPDNGDGFVERHYYTDWDDNIPVCQSIEDVFLFCDTFLNYLGVKIGQDPSLMTTIVRLAKHNLSADGSEPNRTRWLSLTKRTFVPALSLTKHNPAITQEVFELLKLYPTTVRYSVYEEWYTGRTSRLPDMKAAFDRNRAEVKDVLRRITNESGKKQARALAKVAFASPGIVMMTFINQLESYSNMIPGLVDSVRYFSPLAYDVLTWYLIRSLSGQGRDRMQADGMLTSAWLQALSQFVAALFTRYVVVNPSPVLQYVASELRVGDSTDLELIEQVLSEMAGIRSDMNFNDAQVVAMAGGQVLQSQIVQQLADIRHQRKSSAKRLMKALSDPGLIGQILIAIAQERQMYPHREAAQYMPLKVLGNNLDKIQQVFAQYLDVLRANLTPVDFERAVPDTLALIGDFGIEPGTAFAICRATIAYRMSEVDAVRKQLQEDEKQKSRLSREKMNGVAETSTAESSTANGGALQDSDNVLATDATDLTQSQTNGELNVTRAEMTATPQPANALSSDSDRAPWHPVLQDIMLRLPAVTGDLEDRVSVSFYVTFWTLSQQDVHVPTESYQSEIQKLEQQIKEIGRDRSDLSAVASKERERKRRALQDLISQLTKEVSSRVTTFTNMKIWLNSQKRHWFTRTNDKDVKAARHLGLLQECFLPRALMSSLDAHYCFTILKIMHNNGTPGFSMLELVQQLMRKQLLAAVIFQCTAREAENFGRFLCEILKQFKHWQSSKAVYEKEALGSQRQLPGFASIVDEKGTPTELMEYEDSRKCIFHWHTCLKNAFRACFESGEYMQIRNGIIVLKGIHQVFPALKFHGRDLQELLKAVYDNDSRGDLKLAARSLQGLLTNRSSSWLSPQDFRLGDADVEGKESTKHGTDANSLTAEERQSTDGALKLNATAPEFNPVNSAHTNGDASKEPVVGAEDGEIEDEKPMATNDSDVKMEDAASTKEDKDGTEGKASGPSVEGMSVPQVGDMEKQAPNRPESKPSTPVPTLAKPPPATNGGVRDQPGRTTPAQQAHARREPNLPPRPESGPPAKPLPALPSGRYPNRTDDRYGRLERPSEARQPPSRERSPVNKSIARTPQADPYGNQPASRGYRDDRPPQRIPQPDSRYSREENRSIPPRREAHGQAAPSPRPTQETRERNLSAMGPPSQASHPERVGQVRSEAATPSHAQEMGHSSSGQSPLGPVGSSQSPMNPQRAALISDEPLNHARGWDDKDRRRDWQDERSLHHQDVRRNGRIPPPEPSRDVQQHRSEQPVDITPTGPRASRGVPPGSRELFDQAPQRSAPVEPGRGRLSRDILPSNIQQEHPLDHVNGNQYVNNGLNLPNGPSAGRATRNFTAPHPPLQSRASDSSLQTSTPARTMEHPSALRQQPQRFPSGDHRTAGAQAERMAGPSPASAIPSAESGPAVHPSRLAIFGNTPAPIETSMAPSSGVRIASSPTTAPPSGPRSHNRPPAGAPTGPSPIIGPPMGPGFSMERQRRGDRQRANINATLQQGGNNGPAQVIPANPMNQGVQFRGAARQTSSTGPPPTAASSLGAAQPQAIASSMDIPPRHEPTAASSQANPLARAEGARPDLFQRDDKRDPNHARRYEDDRGARGSRNASGERRTDEQPARRPALSGPEDDGRGQRSDLPRGDERNRIREDWSAPRDGPPRERRGGREDGIMPPRRPPPDMQGSFSGPQAPYEWHGRTPRGDGPQESGRGGRGMGRGAEDFRGGRRGEEEWRDGGRGAFVDNAGTPLGPDGRKRRLEDGAPAFDPTKRRRGGR